MKVQFNDLGAQWKLIKGNAQTRIDELFETSAFINGPAVPQFEEHFAKWNGSPIAIGCSNGTDAIKLAIQSLQLEGSVGVFIPANTFIATVFAAEQALPNCSIDLIDCDDFFQMDVEILESKVQEQRQNWEHCIIIPVHLYGHTCDMRSIVSIAEKHNCIIIEDSSQAHGAIAYDNIRVGNYGALSAFSCYPGKNLGAAGDAGVVTTQDPDLAIRIKGLRSMGAVKKYHHEFKGTNNRLDTFQAIILDEKLHFMDAWNLARNEVAKKYNQGITNPKIKTPELAPYCDYQVYHIYCLRVLEGERDAFQEYLKENGITTVIHYPFAVEQTGAFKESDYHNPKARLFASQIISLPMHPFMSDEEINHVIDVVNRW